MKALDFELKLDILLIDGSRNMEEAYRLKLMLILRHCLISLAFIAMKSNPILSNNAVWLPAKFRPILEGYKLISLLIIFWLNLDLILALL